MLRMEAIPERYRETYKKAMAGRRKKSNYVPFPKEVQMKTCETCEHYPDCKADPDCGELKVCEFWSNSPADDNSILLAERGRPCG